MSLFGKLALGGLAVAAIVKVATSKSGARAPLAKKTSKTIAAKTVLRSRAKKTAKRTPARSHA